LRGGLKKREIGGGRPQEEEMAAMCEYCRPKGMARQQDKSNKKKLLSKKKVAPEGAGGIANGANGLVGGKNRRTRASSQDELEDGDPRLVQALGAREEASGRRKG